MAGVTRKTEVGPIDGTPVKRMFWSIISDYDLKTGLCELIDNAIDFWNSGSKRKPLLIDVRLDPNRQLISITDNAGGVREADLDLLITPGGSNNDPRAETIGIFGVGSKRAGIALGEHVLIRTRYKSQDAHEIEIAKEWLESDDWKLAYYKIPDFAAGSTQVEISKLRKPFTETDIPRISQHFGETYSSFLRDSCSIRVNGQNIEPLDFDHWAFPKGFNPQAATFSAEVAKDSRIAVEIVGGLITDREPDQDNYGVYFYCNNRLVVKELRTHEVGYFITSEAGVPHPDASLCRAIVKLQGPAQEMPWNSSKSGINFSHAAFEAVRPTLIQLTSHYSSLSRRLKHDWETKVFPHKKGKIDLVNVQDITSKHPLVLPPLPKVNKPRVEKLKAKNKKQIDEMPWTLGLVEAMDAVEVLERQSYETKNRIGLILLDSNFEIALKEFIVHRDDLFPPNQFGRAAIARLFERRSDVIAAITAQVTIPRTLLNKAQHFYNIRNKLIHERATVEPTKTDLRNYRATIEKILKILFGLRF